MVATELSTQHAAFLEPDWDVNTYANQVLGTDSAQELGAALNRLNGGIDDLNRQLKSQITLHHERLLSQTAAMSSLNDSLAKVQNGLTEVEGGVSRLKLKIAAPYQDLASSIDRMKRLHRAADVTRRAARLAHLARRLETQMSDLGQSKTQDRALAEAALTLAELDKLRQEPEGEDIIPLRTITALQVHLEKVDACQDQVTSEMEDMVREGLTSLNQSTLASSLQTAANLSVLPSMVSSLVSDLTEAIEMRIRATFDMHSLGREMAEKEGASAGSASSFGYRSRARTEPTNVTLPQWSAALWSRMQLLVSDMADCCIKVYLLENVLGMKRDAMQTSFLTICLPALDNKPSLIFWTTLASTFETQAKELARTSNFAQQTLGQSYPKLLRMFQDFYNKIALHTDTVYTHKQQSPETVLLLRSVLPFENIYLARSNSRLNEAVAAAVQGGARSPPGANEGLTVARAMCNELDSARFDPLLVRSVARNVARAMELFLNRMDVLVAVDYSATSLVGPTSPPSQMVNIELANGLYHFYHPTYRTITADYTAETSVPDLILPILEQARSQLSKISTPLFAAIRRELSHILARMHRTNFETPPPTDSDTSVYMKDFGDKLAYIRTNVLAAFRVGTLAKDWVTDLARFLMRHFVLHASIVRPLSEEGRLRLVSDLTTLEFSISQLLSDHKLALNVLGEDFTNLRSFRPLLFVETSELATSAQTQNVPLLPLLHHILVRSPLDLPHKAHGWSESEYVKWISDHTQAEQTQLVQGIVERWEQGGQDSKGGEYVALLKQVLGRASGQPQA